MKNSRTLAFCLGTLLVSHFVGAGQASADFPAIPLEVSQSVIYAHESQKLTFSVPRDWPGQSGPGPGRPRQSEDQKISIVQVDEQGGRVRYLGWLNEKKGQLFRRVEFQERKTGRLFFVAVPDDELNPFVAKKRPTISVEVLARPSFLEALSRIWTRLISHVKSNA